MVRKEKVQAVILTYVVSALVLLVLPVDYIPFGLCVGSPFYTRLTYMFFHANLLHWFVNSLCLLQIAFFMKPTPAMVIWSALIAMSFPDALLASVPTIGASGLCYALLGRLSGKVARPLRWHAYMLPFLAIGFLFPQLNGSIHLYCYSLGVVLAMLNKPVGSWRRK